MTAKIEMVKEIPASDAIKDRMIHVRNEAAGNHAHRLVASRCPACSPRKGSMYGAKLMVKSNSIQYSNFGAKKLWKSKSEKCLFPFL